MRQLVGFGPNDDGGLARSHLTAAAGIEPVVASAAGIALAGLAFYPRSVR
jgi:hypothetical protein